MAKSMELPQDIIDNIIAAAGDDTHLLKQCSLVSSSFLRPSHKQLFSRITIRGRTCDGIHQLLVQNPAILSFVKAITLIVNMKKMWRKIPEWINGPSLLAILRLPFCCLESFSIIMCMRDWVWPGTTWSWNNFCSGLNDALSNIIQLSTLKTLSPDEGITKVSITFGFFLHLDDLTTLELHSLPQSDFGCENSSSLTRAASKGMTPTASYTVFDRCVWNFSYMPRRDVSDKGCLFLPFMCRPRFFEINIVLYSPHDLGIVSFLLGSLHISLTPPATLEHLKINFRFPHSTCYGFFNRTFFGKLRDADVWKHLDSISSLPTSSRLQRVDINIEYSFHHDDDGDEPGKDEIEKSVLDGLPLLRTKGILFVKAVLEE